MYNKQGVRNVVKPLSGALFGLGKLKIQKHLPKRVVSWYDVNIQEKSTKIHWQERKKIWHKKRGGNSDGYGYQGRGIERIV